MHHNQAASLLDKDLKKKPRSDVQRAKWRWAMGNGMEMSSDELLDLSESNTWNLGFQTVHDLYKAC